MSDQNPRRCELCRFAEKDAGTVNTSLVCHRYPPTVFPVMSQRGVEGQVTMRPTVKIDATCGEFQASLMQ